MPADSGTAAFLDFFKGKLFQSEFILFNVLLKISQSSISNDQPYEFFFILYKLCLYVLSGLRSFQCFTVLKRYFPAFSLISILCLKFSQISIYEQLFIF